MPRRPLMVRAALLRRSCDGVAAATELRRSRCCDGAAQTSSVALILRVASRRDALNEEPASFPPGRIQISMVVAHSPRPPPWPRDILEYKLNRSTPLQSVGPVAPLRITRLATLDIRVVYRLK